MGQAFKCDTCGMLFVGKPVKEDHQAIIGSKFHQLVVTFGLFERTIPDLCDDCFRKAVLLAAREYCNYPTL